MFRSYLTAGLCLLVIASCQTTADKTPVPAADSAFHRVEARFTRAYLDFHPATAVALGFHQYDGRIARLDKPSLDRALAGYKAFQSELTSMDTAGLSATSLYDYQLLLNAINGERWSFEGMRSYERNPMAYLGNIDPDMYLKRNFAPLPDRVRALIQAESSVPALLAAAKQNLADSLPLPYLQLSMAIGQGTISFMRGDVPVAVKEVKDDALIAAFTKTNQTAVDSIEAFLAWLKTDKMPRATTHYGIGRDHYQEMLHTEGIDMTPEKLLSTGLAELKKEQDAFNADAKIINPSKKPVDVYKDLQKEHPKADSLIPFARINLESIRGFLVKNNIVTMPSEVRAVIRETPPYARSTSTASMDTPGPFEKKATEAYYYITPVDPAWTPKQKEDWLRQFDYYTTDNVTIHEVYPGHYTQFLHLNASGATQTEKIFASYSYVEGWAHYTEKMMTEEHYGSTGDPVKAAKYRLAQSGDALLRLCRLCVSVKTHCEGISVDEGTKFFMDNWYQGDKPSRQEALRGTFDPGYCFYTLGKLQLIKLREDYRRQEGADFSLQKFHDAVLDHGMPTIRMLRQLLLKDKSQWDAIL